MLVDVQTGELVMRGRAIASEVSIRVLPAADPASTELGLTRAMELFAAVEAACSRFKPTSALSRANARPARPVRVGSLCLAVLREARAAHVLTAGRFDPRVLDDLVNLGYGHSLPFETGGVEVNHDLPAVRPARPPWCPRFVSRGAVAWLGPHRVDLGGIAKGVAVRWASAILASIESDYLVEAGGDCYCSGSAPGGSPWRIGVENPDGSADPLAVLALENASCATSSVRLRHWKLGATEVHHLIDPATGRPAAGGLASVTVVGTDPALSEVWSKVLFIEGSKRADAIARDRQLAALWVSDSGKVHWSPDMDRYLMWVAR